LSDESLYAEYLKLRDAYNRANSIPYLVDSFLTSGASDWLAELITAELKTKVAPAEIPACLAQLTAPTITSFSGRELIDLLRLAIRFRKTRDKTALARDLREHARRYYWIENSYYPKEPNQPSDDLVQPVNDKTPVWKNIVIRYKQSYLGILWAVLKPIMLMLIFTLVRSFVGIETGDIPYPILTFAALLPWVFFQESASEGVSSVTSNASLIKKIYFPREVFPITSMVTK